MSVEWRMDDHEVTDHFARRSGAIDFETVLALEAALMTVFQATQASVHVISGKLRESGRVDSEIRNNIWTGKIEYGGKGTGVDYAGWEQRRGDSHDFMEVAQEMDSIIGVAFRVGLED